MTVTRKAGLSESMTVDFATSDGSAREGLEYFGSSGTASFAPGQGTKTLTVQVLPASTYRGDRAFAMVLSNPVGAGARLGFQKTAVVSLVDTKPVPRIQFGKATYTGIEGATAFRVSVLRSGPTDAPVTVDFSTGDGSATGPGDYEPVTGTLTFASGVRSGFFTVRLLEHCCPGARRVSGPRAYEPRGWCDPRRPRHGSPEREGQRSGRAVWRARLPDQRGGEPGQRDRTAHGRKRRHDHG